MHSFSQPQNFSSMNSGMQIRNVNPGISTQGFVGGSSAQIHNSAPVYHSQSLGNPVQTFSHNAGQTFNTTSLHTGNVGSNPISGTVNMQGMHNIVNSGNANLGQVHNMPMHNMPGQMNNGNMGVNHMAHNGDHDGHGNGNWNHNHSSFFFGIGTPFFGYSNYPWYGYGYYPGYNNYAYPGFSFGSYWGSGVGLNVGLGYGGGYGYGAGYGYGPGYNCYAYQPYGSYNYGGVNNVGYGSYAYAPTVVGYSPTADVIATATVDGSVPTAVPTQAALSAVAQAAEVATVTQPTTLPTPGQPTTAETPEGNQRLTDAMNFAAQGEQMFKEGKYDNAIRAWQHSMVEDNRNGAVMLLVSQALFAQAKFNESAGALQQALQMLPEDKWNTVVGNYTKIYPNIQGYTDQLRVLEKGMKDKPEDPAIRLLLGYHYGYLGYPKQAVRELTKGLELAPKDELAKKMLAQFQAKLAGESTSVLTTPANTATENTTKSDTGAANATVTEGTTTQ
jgi:cytochrome c-type biogenesis protein CcmH/NrfG